MKILPYKLIQFLFISVLSFPLAALAFPGQEEGDPTIGLHNRKHPEHSSPVILKGAPSPLIQREFSETDPLLDKIVQEQPKKPIDQETINKQIITRALGHILNARLEKCRELEKCGDVIGYGINLKEYFNYALEAYNPRNREGFNTVLGIHINVWHPSHREDIWQACRVVKNNHISLDWFFSYTKK